MLIFRKMLWFAADGEEVRVMGVVLKDVDEIGTPLRETHLEVKIVKDWHLVPSVVLRFWLFFAKAVQIVEIRHLDVLILGSRNGVVFFGSFGFAKTFLVFSRYNRYHRLQTCKFIQIHSV